MRAYNRGEQEQEEMSKLFDASYRSHASADAAWYMDAFWKKVKKSILGNACMYLFGGVMLNSNSFTYSLHYLPMVSNIENLFEASETIVSILSYEYNFLRSASKVYKYYEQSAIIKEKVLACSSKIDTNPLQGDLLLDASGVEIAFRDGKSLNIGDDFSISRGEIVLLKGENGAGKTSFLKAVLHGIGVRGDANIRRAEDIFMVLQQTNLPNSKISKYLDVQNPESRNKFLNIVEGLGFYEVLNNKAQYIAQEKGIEKEDGNYSEYMGDISLSSFSGGEKDKMKILMGLLSGKSLLFMDETFASLDVDNKSRVQDFLKAYVAENNIAICVIDHQDVLGQSDNFYTKKYLAEKGEEHNSVRAI
jgi:ABC-type Mn2+/Zn2+ transport system ATPase subunit